MLVKQPLAPQNTGPQGVHLVAEAEKFEAILWGDVLTSMTRSAIPNGSLGTGSSLYGDLAIHAVAGSLFGATDSRLTQEIVAQLKSDSSVHDKPVHTPTRLSNFSTAAALSSIGSSQSVSPANPSMLHRATSFARLIWPEIKTAAADLDVPPEALLAQSALETGWGASTPGNNLFGVKATAGQAANVEPTKEEQHSTMEATHAAFASYPSPAASIDHFVALVQRTYHNAIGSASVPKYAAALASGGYATDLSYAQKIVGVAESPLMQSVLQLIEGTNQ